MKQPRLSGGELLIHVFTNKIPPRSPTCNKMLCYCIQCRAAQRGRTRPGEFCGLHQQQLPIEILSTLTDTALLFGNEIENPICHPCPTLEGIFSRPNGHSFPSFQVVSSIFAGPPSWTHPLQCVCSCPPSYWRKAWTTPRATHMRWTKHGQSPVKLQRSQIAISHKKQSPALQTLSQSHIEWG